MLFTIPPLFSSPQQKAELNCIIVSQGFYLQPSERSRHGTEQWLSQENKYNLNKNTLLLRSRPAFFWAQLGSWEFQSTLMYEKKRELGFG